MRDIVETVIGQVMKKQPTMKPTTSPDKNLVSLKGSHVQEQVNLKEKDEKLWGVCCQFESMFLQQMMSSMRKTIPESKLLPRSYADDMYQGMMDQAIAESGSKQAPLGLALSMYKQLQRDGHTSGEGSSSIQEIQKAADTIKMSNVIDKPSLGGV